MKKMISAMAFCLWIIGAHAQDRYQDAIYVRGGNIYRGVILEHNDSLIRIEITGGSIFVLPDKVIDSLKREKIKSIKATIFRQKSFGFVNLAEAGITSGSRQTNFNYTTEPLIRGFTLQTIAGYRFYTHFIPGIGLGIDADEHCMLRFFGDIRYELVSQQITPYFYANGGYSVDLSASTINDYQKTEYTGGAAITVGAGLRFNFNNHGALLITAGYKAYHRKEETIFNEVQGEDAQNPTITRYTYHRLLISAGFAF